MNRKKNAFKEPSMDLSTLVIFLLNLVETYSLGVPVAFLPEDKDLETLRPGKRGALLFFTLVEKDRELYAMRVFMLKREGAYAPSSGEVLHAIAGGLSTSGRLLPKDVFIKAQLERNVHVGTRIDDTDTEKVQRSFDINACDLLLTVKALTDTKPSSEAAG